MTEVVMTPSESKSFCDNIKLSEFNQIQSYGAILVLDEKLQVIQYSENVLPLLETTDQELLNKPITTFVDIQNINEDATAWLTREYNKYKKIDCQLPTKNIQVWICAHETPQGIIVEIEPYWENKAEEKTLFDLMQYVVDGMKKTTSSQNMQDLIQSTCDEIQKITGYDRVMAYQFDEHDDSGVVVGERIVNNMESYLGLHFPATDVPKNVRDMYLKLPLRYIPSIETKSEKIIPELNPVNKAYLDLSGIALRMVAPVHIKYLENMGVAASMSIAIIHNEKLWGLIACHHHEPKYLSVNLRLILMLMGNTLGIQVAALDCSKEFIAEQRVAELIGSLTENIYKEDSLLYALDAYHATIMELVKATGMSIYFQNNLLSYGETPTKDQVMGIVEWLKREPIHLSFATSSLPLIFNKAVDYKDKACGLLVIPITRMQNHYMIIYRPELVRSIYWAGNPDDTLKCEGDKYSPRASFERFMQTVTNHSVPWTTHDIKAAEFIRSIVVNKQLQDLLQVQAMHDPLTGLFNRLYLDQRLEMELNRAERKSQPLAIILVDLDFFKKVNDNYGHQAGDYVLTEFAVFLKNCFRGYDYLYRYGGEEFMIVLPDTDEALAQQKTEMLRHDIKELKLEFEDKSLPAITISAGIAVYPDNGTDGRSLIAAADKALYKAKATGRDKVICAIAH